MQCSEEGDRSGGVCGGAWILAVKEPCLSIPSASWGEAKRGAASWRHLAGWARAGRP